MVLLVFCEQENIVLVDSDRLSEQSTFRRLGCIMELKLHTQNLEQTERRGDSNVTYLFQGDRFLIKCQPEVDDGKQ